MRTTHQYVILLSIFTLFGLASSPVAGQQPDARCSVEMRHWLEKNIPLHMADSKMPGFSIAIVKDGKTIYAEGFGARDPQRNLPSTADTLYGIGSITKSMVAIEGMKFRV